MTDVEFGRKGLQLAALISTEAFNLRVEEEPPSLEQIRKTFVGRHLKNIATLASEVFETEEDHKKVSSRLAVRTMLESTFNIGAALKRPEFGVEKIILELEDDARRTSIAGRYFNDPGYDPVADGYSQQAAELRQRLGINPNQELSKTKKIAELAGLEFQYFSGYFQFSKHSHATSGGMLGYEHGLGERLVLDMTLFSLFFGCWLSLGVLPTKHGEAYQKTLQELIDHRFPS